MQQKSELKKTHDGTEEKFHHADHADFYPGLIPLFQKPAKKAHFLIDKNINGPPVLIKHRQYHIHYYPISYQIIKTEKIIHKQYLIY
jgi:hypothetical protein